MAVNIKDMLLASIDAFGYCKSNIIMFDIEIANYKEDAIIRYKGDNKIAIELLDVFVNEEDYDTMYIIVLFNDGNYIKMEKDEFVLVKQVTKRSIIDRR